MAALTTATRKRSAADGGACSVAGGKKTKLAMVTFGSIYNYEKQEVLGEEGTYGVVKWIRGEGEGEGAPDVRGVLREAGCLAACGGHPNIVEIMEVAADAATGSVFLVVEFVGASLQQTREEDFSEAEVRGYMRQLFSGAERMHAAGLVNRDLKPDNILFGAEGELKICDFGMARPGRPDGKAYSDWWAGTPCYRSPEQVVGNPHYGPDVDMWALGCVMAEILFDADTEEGILVVMAMDMLHEFTETGLQAFGTFKAFWNLPEMSPAGHEVLAGLLNFDAGERLTAAAALKHRWFAEDTPPKPPRRPRDDRPFFHFLLVRYPARCCR
jgi:cell division cycle 2-like